MKMPFTVEQFFEVFEKYNTAVWPLQVLFFLLGVIAVVLVIKKIKYSDRIISAILAFLWFWIGIAYHLIFFTVINKAAFGFGIIFILQGLVLFIIGVIKGNLSFKYEKNIYGFAGSILLVYAMLIYPAIGYFLGHVYPNSPSFGLPCPTTIFTFGILLFSSEKFPKPVLIIPLLWTLIGSSAAFAFGVYEDIGLFISGITAGTLLFLRRTTGK